MPVNIIHSTRGICNYELDKPVKKRGKIAHYCHFTKKYKRYAKIFQESVISLTRFSSFRKKTIIFSQ